MLLCCQSSCGSITPQFDIWVQLRMQNLKCKLNNTSRHYSIQYDNPGILIFAANLLTLCHTKVSSVKLIYWYLPVTSLETWEGVYIVLKIKTKILCRPEVIRQPRIKLFVMIPFLSLYYLSWTLTWRRKGWDWFLMSFFFFK